MYLDIKQKSQKVLMLFGLAGIIWWAIVSKIRYQSVWNLPFINYVPYILFLVVIGIGLYNFIRYKKIKSSLDVLEEKLTSK
ncbi:hypothetical protein [Bacillus cereus]|uniref:hypothetical protein n=1 Tax=Bacillus cereus TaxID=1396 RepID=UPI000B4AC790|nr:hypothetical protein [Bacillus cereus]